MPIQRTASGFHSSQDINQVADTYYYQTEQFTYTFENFFHPFVGELIAQLNQTSLADMLDPAFLQGLTASFFNADYTPTTSETVQLNTFQKSIDVQPGGPYANYNWELLYHIPVAIAVHLSKNQRFAEAQKWFHFVFDPTSHDETDPAWLRYWKFLGFRQETDVQNINSLLVLLSTPDAELTPTQIQAKKTVLAGYDAINRDPFQPHAVARTRPLAYQYYVVMKYLDNLIAWGDSLFLQDTVETINEATLCYVLAANLLGERPQQLPPRGIVAPKNFAQLKQAGLDRMGDAIVNLEGQFPFNLAPPSEYNNKKRARTGPLWGIGRTLYFCIPQNQTLLAYWDLVADRLFKIRHCMNIEGIVRPLALFDPPLDPGMLVKAAAAGIDIGSIVSGLNQPPSPVRSLTMIQKALEICSEVRALGNALLSALEKGDAEQLALLRQDHEVKLQQMTQEVRFLQWKQAQAATQSLLRTRATTLERYKYYLHLLGATPDPNVTPDMLTLDQSELTEEKFDDVYSKLVGEYDQAITLRSYTALKLAGNLSPSNQSGATGVGPLYLNTNEDADLNKHGPKARKLRTEAMAIDRVSSVYALFPDMGINMHFMGLGAHAKVFGGSLLAAAGHFYSSLKNTEAANEEGQATMASKTAGYQRRVDDWIFQSNLAAHELMQMGRQIISSLIAEQVAYHEYLNIKAQIKQTQDVIKFLQTKFTNADLYNWMQGEVSRLYYQYYRFAFDTARKAEQTMKRELMRPELDATDYIQFNYWDAGHKGLLSGEAIYLDLKRMEMAYHENNKREFELTRHVSLRQLDPLALLELKVTGSCAISIPEWFYDRDCPGHYMRRIKTVGISLPSVVGPYTTVNCTLTLQRSSVRTSPLLSNGVYRRDLSGDDARFVDYFASSQAIVTSGANNDSGMFETNLRDERFLPFEGAGAVSTWSLALPPTLRAFDYMTISDVILHVRYTARDGGALLGTQATTELVQMLDTANQSGLALLFSLRYDFPTEWSAFVNGTGDFAFTLRKDYFPYIAQSGPLTVDALVLYAQDGEKLVQTTLAVSPNLARDLNGANGASDLAFPEDSTVLTRMPGAQVFLILQYHLGS